MISPLAQIQQEVISCQACPRLLDHCRKVAEVKRRAYFDWDYWGKPVPSFGDPKARLLLIGLAPGAHGANRTGQMFTGDASGDFLFPVLYKAGFASQPQHRTREDGFQLLDAYITGAGRCAPPDNKPLPTELANCSSYLARELKVLKNVEVVVTLGRIAFEAYLGIVKPAGKFIFEHGRVHNLQPFVISSYHPSQQNTQTGRLTEQMFLNIFYEARSLIRHSS